ncbi:MAG: hypothetical protein K0U93_20045 [Gammaproteobacteria bacterium]|nr:hypothetical protein [Gammaproteobacteria bacterium]
MGQEAMHVGVYHSIFLHTLYAFVSMVLQVTWVENVWHGDATAFIQRGENDAENYREVSRA